MGRLVDQSVVQHGCAYYHSTTDTYLGAKVGDRQPLQRMPASHFSNLHQLQALSCRASLQHNYPPVSDASSHHKLFCATSDLCHLLTQPSILASLRPCELLATGAAPQAVSIPAPSCILDPAPRYRDASYHCTLVLTLWLPLRLTQFQHDQQSTFCWLGAKFAFTLLDWAFHIQQVTIAIIELAVRCGDCSGPDDVSILLSSDYVVGFATVAILA